MTTRRGKRTRADTAVPTDAGADVADAAAPTPTPATTVSGEQLERALLDLLSKRAAGATCCPSEAPRRLSTNWRPLMQAARDAARRLADQGVVEITQRGVVIDHTQGAFKGPIRVRLCAAKKKEGGG